MKTGKWRHELKYNISVAEYISLKSCISRILHRDENSRDGEYVIESLYFDDFRDTALKEKTFGIDEREKFRIRLYNGDTSFIRLEKKQKKNGLCKKSSAIITEAEMKRLILGTLPLADDELLREFYVKKNSKQLMPKTIVKYRREAFTYKPGNVRVTFDKDIRTGLYSNGFPMDITGAPATKPGLIVLEIKYDEFLPDTVRDAVQAGYPRVQAFSKYAVCRAFE